MKKMLIGVVMGIALAGFANEVPVYGRGDLDVDTKGEGMATVDMGSHTFLKVKVESAAKTEGSVE